MLTARGDAGEDMTPRPVETGAVSGFPFQAKCNWTRRPDQVPFYLSILATQNDQSTNLEPLLEFGLQKSEAQPPARLGPVGRGGGARSAFWAARGS